jgi:DNA-directed RNA polymerase specialized sigma subunit
MAEYLKNKDFTEEIIRCKETGELTSKAIKMFIILANRTVRKLTHRDPRDREDCIQSALYDLIKYWKNFKPEVSNNAFAFFTQIVKNGYAKEFKKIHKNKADHISVNQSGDSEIYTM